MVEIPEWAALRADMLVSAFCHEQDKRFIGTAEWRTAFARYIAEHEQEPVDPLLIEARAIVKNTLTPDRHKACNCRSEIDAGKWDDGQKVRASLAALKRGIEIGKSQ